MMGEKWLSLKKERKQGLKSHILLRTGLMTRRNRNEMYLILISNILINNILVNNRICNNNSNNSSKNHKNSNGHVYLAILAMLDNDIISCQKMVYYFNGAIISRIWKI